MADGGNSRIVGNEFRLNETAQTDIMVSLNAVSYTNVSGNYFFSGRTSGVTAVKVTSASYSVVNGNTMSLAGGTAIDCTSSNMVIVSNNAINMASGTGSIGIVLTSASWMQVNNNRLINLETGMTAVNTAQMDNLMIDNNAISNCKQIGINLQGCTYSSVCGNMVTNPGSQTANTYPAILLTSTGTAYSIYNKVADNTIKSTVTNKHSYGIRENSANDGPNIITGNVALNAATAQISTQNTSSIVANNLTA